MHNVTLCTLNLSDQDFHGMHDAALVGYKWSSCLMQGAWILEHTLQEAELSNRSGPHGAHALHAL